MRTSVGFRDYRAWYYFFQYQYFVRSEAGRKRNAPESQIAQFLRNLVYDPEDAHYRWEIPTERPQKQPRRKPRDSDPVAPAQKIVLYRAKKNSVRQRFMLFDYPKRHRADHIKTLYKSLLVYDLLQSGKTAYSVAKMLIVQAETLPSISRLRSTTKWYDHFFDINLKPFEQTDITDGPAIEKYNIRFLSTDPQWRGFSLKGELESPLDAARSRTKDIERYGRIAHKLIQLAQSGRFKTFPSEISHIK